MNKFATSRREFLTASTGLIVGAFLPSAAMAKSGAAAVLSNDSAGAASFAPNAFIRIAPDNSVTVLIKHIEFGQGVYTGLATIVAEDLDADWAQMRAEHAPADVKLYANTLFGIQGTGGSTAVANSYTQLRQAAATARAMLVTAAAQTWSVPAGEITVDKGVISHAKSGKSANFGAFAEAATKIDPPKDVKLKPAKDFKLIGTDVAKLDSKPKSTGAATFTIDVYKDGMLTVVVARPPKFGATLKSFDSAEALKVKGVEKVVKVPSGVAVYAKSTARALRGRDALKVLWDEAGAETRSSEDLYKVFAEAARKPAKVAEEAGDVSEAMSKAEKTHDAEYYFPYLAHAPLEPLDAVIEWKAGNAEVWMGSQLQTVDHKTTATVLGVKPEAVKINTMFAGGSFGRRAQPTSHVAAEISAIAKEAGDGTYKLLWTREDDIQGGYYRPLTVHRLKGGLDKDGNIVAWENTIANQSIIAGSPFESMMKDGLDPTSFEGSTKMPYAWPNARVSWARMESKVPVLWWRSVGHTHTAYATETFLDELLEMGGKDPVEGRLALMKESAGRDRAVLQKVAEMCKWSGAKAANEHARGVALHESFSSYVAMVAEVSNVDDEPKVHKVWCAVDCGIAVNPNVIRAQIEGGIGYGLGSALYDEITLETGGRVAQSNFDTYRMLRINEMPDVEVAIIQSDADPTGVGEPGVPPIAPAVANAWRVLTGKTPRRLPMVSA